MQVQRNYRDEANAGAGDARRKSKLGTSAAHNQNLGIVLDIELVRQVQLRATGANIHALAQHLQIYVGAVDCGAVSLAQATETKLREWLAASRRAA